MRFFIRTRTKYDPSLAFKDPVIVVNVDHTQEITKIKEEARKVGKGCKITALYLARRDGSFVDLADDRTINYYNLQDDTILETTSNPFWVTTLYSNMRRREQEAASNPEDARLCFQAQKSYIRRCMAIGLLLNGTGETEKQPATFPALEDLYEYCLNQGKKPAYMSQFTLEELQEMFETFQEEHQHHRDPIGSFIYSQSMKLGYLQDDDPIDGGDPFRSHFEQAGEQQRDVQVRRNGAGGGGRRRANRNRTCEDCEVTMATSYCADCNPPLCLCDNCWRSLHRGATRRNHQIKDISEAPTPTSYTPQAYRAPFAMLVAFHRALQEQPQKLSLTAEDIKTRAQPFTDTDLEEAKKRGKPFSGFDSLENALMKHNIVLKEAAATPKYSLLEAGKELALKCSNFDYAVQTLLRQVKVPTVPAPAIRPVFIDNRQVCLLVDVEEPQKDRFVKVARERGLSARVRKLPTGDFCWILLPPGAPEREAPEQELVLPYLVERKTWDDLWSSVRTPRFENQVQRMKVCGILNLFYLVEGSPKEISGRPGPEVETFLQGKLDRLLLQDKFFVNRTPSWLKTVEWLCHLTNLAIECQKTRDRTPWMTFAEFSMRTNSVHAPGIHRNARPASGIVWTASDFVDNIKSHHKHQRDLGSNLDHVRQLSDSLLVIQGLTAYNTNCNSHLKKSLADYLQLPGQTAEECVQIYLEDYTDQLVSVNVFQYYVLYLEVFKRVRIFRTETNEETQEFLSRFGGQETVVKGDQTAGQEAERPNVQPPGAAANKVDDMLFANDSQEEEFMLNQALQQSLADENDPHNYDNGDLDDGLDDVDGVNDNGDDSGGRGGSSRGSSEKDGSCAGGSNVGSSCGSNGSRYCGGGSSGGGCGSGNGDDGGGDGKRKQTPKTNLEYKTTKQQHTKYNHVDNNKGNAREAPDEPAPQTFPSTSTVTVKKEREEEEENYLENILQFKFYDSLKGEGEDGEKENKKNSKQDSEEDELRKIMEESRLQYEKEEEERKALLKSVYNEEEELRKALELSRKEMEMEQKKTKGMGEIETLNFVSTKNSAIPISNSSDGDESDLPKVIEHGKNDRMPNRIVFGKERVMDSFSEERKFISEDGQLQKVLELSKTEFKQQPQEICHKDPKPDRHKQDDESEDFLHELEVPDFVDGKNSEQGVELSSEENKYSASILSPSSRARQNPGRKYSSINFKNPTSTNVDDDGGNDDDDDDNDIGCKFGERFGNISAGKSKGNSKYNYNHYSTNIDDASDEDDDDDDDDISRKFRERFGNTVSNMKANENYHDLETSTPTTNNDDLILIESQGMDDDDDADMSTAQKLQERFNKETNNLQTNKRGIHSSSCHRSNSNITFDDGLFIDSQDETTDESIAKKLQEQFDKETSDLQTNKSGTQSSSTSSLMAFDDAILIDSQNDYSPNENTDKQVAQKLQEHLDTEAGSSKKSSKNHSSTSYFDDAILVDSQDGHEVDSISDFEVALRLQNELNQQGYHENSSNRPSSLTSPSRSLHNTNTVDQISSYRVEQQKRYRESKSGKASKNMTPGLAFRQKAEAIAKGKESLLSVVQPSGSGSTPRRRPEKRGHDGTIKNGLDESHVGRRTARKSSPTSTITSLTEARNNPPSSSDSASSLVFPGSSPRPQEKQWRASQKELESSSSSSSSFVFPGSFSSPRRCDDDDEESRARSSGAFSFPGSSSCSRDSRSSYNNTSSGGFVFPSSAEYSNSPSPRPSTGAMTSTINTSQSRFHSDAGGKGMASSTIMNGPKCSDCGEIGHRKGTKRCPYYYTEEAQRKREEQAKKRKEKREEEDRQMQNSCDAVTADQLRKTEQINQLQRQLEQIRRQNEDLPKVVEDAMKYLKKRRKK